jgi:hypothetical protein
MTDWMIARDAEHTQGDGPVFDGDKNAPIWTVYIWHRKNEDDWVEAVHEGGLTYPQAETVAKGKGFTGDPVGV